MKKKLSSTGIVVGILIVGILYLWFSFKPGFVYENGTWNYVSYDTGAGRRVSPINVNKDEFKVLKYRDFARDNNSVYFKNYKVEGSDPETFKIISTKGRFHYAKDKNNVYIYASDDWSIFKVINADPDSFKVLKYPYSKDKNDAYCGSIPLFVDDVSTFEVIKGARFSTQTSYENFLTRQNDPSNRKKYEFITESVIYSEDAKAKTEHLTYLGYKLVEDNQMFGNIARVEPENNLVEVDISEWDKKDIKSNIDDYGVSILVEITNDLIIKQESGSLSNINSLKIGQKVLLNPPRRIDESITYEVKEIIMLEMSDNEKYKRLLSNQQGRYLTTVFIKEGDLLPPTMKETLLGLQSQSPMNFRVYQEDYVVDYKQELNIENFPVILVFDTNGLVLKTYDTDEMVAFFND
ncbi:MAG TPA: DKNYY domain-containing protein [Candidatus Paenibacillus intestinavium]|nr:DKNYY domain-containing protein [Candidatus Paenibacillus intestinavium]